MDFDTLRGGRVVLDAGVVADWGAAHLGVTPAVGRIDPRRKKALDEQVKKKRIQAKDRHVVELALGASARGVLTTDNPLVDGINGHANLNDTLAAWHVEDAAASLPDDERRPRSRSE